jgi:hypothetical protein
MFITCKDGFSMSVVANKFAYAIPRIDNALRYENVEVGFINRNEPLLGDNGYEVWGYVPVDIVKNIVVKHGGTRYMPGWLRAVFGPSEEESRLDELEAIQDRLMGI